MKMLEKLMSQRYAQPAARWMKVFCYLVICFQLACLGLSFLGRQTFCLFTEEGVYENAIYAEARREPASHSLTVSMDDDVYVHAGSQGQVEPITQLALSLMLAVKAVPSIVAYWLLSRVLDNVAKGRIFTGKNAGHLLVFGLIEGGTALFAPLVRLLLCALANLLAESQVSVSTGSGTLNTLLLSAAFIVAASIIHYGIHLQDEVDHTL